VPLVDFGNNSRHSVQLPVSALFGVNGFSVTSSNGFALKKLSRIQARIEHCNFAPARLLMRKYGGLFLVLYAFAKAL
jgi:hypothetical protein